MKITTILIVAFGFGLANAALAAPADPKDVNAIATCLDAARKDGGFGGGCPGAVADPCIKAVQQTDKAVQAAKACAERELAVWTARLQEITAVVKKNASPKIWAAVADAQKSGKSSRERLCPVFNNLDPGLSLGQSAYCLLHEVASQVLVLEWLAAAVSEH
jgi:hypothetical protein